MIPKLQLQVQKIKFIMGRRDIQIKWHNIVRQLISNGVISKEFARLENNLTDLLTKGLTRQFVYDTSKGMGLNPIE